MPSDEPAPQPPKHPTLRWLRNVFLAGLAAVIPILGTVWLLIFIFKVLHKVGVAIINAILNALNALRQAVFEGGSLQPDDSWSLDKFSFPATTSSGSSSPSPSCF